MERAKVCERAKVGHLIIEAAREVGPEPGAVREVGSGGHLGSRPAAPHPPAALLPRQILHVRCYVRHLPPTTL
jgi:hypothetical protein